VKHCFVILLILSLKVLNVKAQQQIVFHHDFRMDTLMQRSLEKNIKEKGMQGFRVQIYSGSNRQTANQVKSLFMQSYPDVRVYLSFTQPYFKVRAGDFRTRIEAFPLYFALKQDEKFKGVMIVPDKIEFPELKY